MATAVFQMLCSVGPFFHSIHEFGLLHLSRFSNAALSGIGHWGGLKDRYACLEHFYQIIPQNIHLPVDARTRFYSHLK